MEFLTITINGKEYQYRGEEAAQIYKKVINALDKGGFISINLKQNKKITIPLNKVDYIEFEQVNFREEKDSSQENKIAKFPHPETDWKANWI